jgi:cell division protein ZapA (FtsZ GTPase activity inhibitor)
MKIELLGTSFSIHTDEDPKHLQDIIDYLKTKIQEVRGSVTTADPLKIAILSALLATDELFKERARARRDQGESEQVEEITRRILRELESTLQRSPVPGLSTDPPPDSSAPCAARQPPDTEHRPASD